MDRVNARNAVELFPHKLGEGKIVKWCKFSWRQASRLGKDRESCFAFHPISKAFNISEEVAIFDSELLPMTSSEILGSGNLIISGRNL